MKLRLLTPHTALGEDLRGCLESAGFEEIEVVDQPASGLDLRLAGTSGLDRVQRALELLRPLTPPVRRDRSDGWTVRVRAARLIGVVTGPFGRAES